MSLRFRDAALEAGFQDHFFETSVPYVRLALVLGIGLWAIFGGLALLVIRSGVQGDLLLRYGIAIPATVVVLILTYTPDYRRWWQGCLMGLLLLSAVVWTIQRTLVDDARPDWGYAGLMLILAFTYVFSRLQFVHAALAGVAMIVFFNVVSVWLIHDTWRNLAFADFFLLAFAAAGTTAAYGLERFTRLLYLRERQLDGERARSDGLLRNTLPLAIVQRLKARDATPTPGAAFLADGLPAVTVRSPTWWALRSAPPAPRPRPSSRCWTTYSAASTASRLTSA